MRETQMGEKVEVITFSIYQISGQQFSRVLIGSRNSEYPWLFTVLRRERKMARRFAKVSEEKINTAFFYPSDLVNTKTTINQLPLRVGEERWIYTSTLRVSVYIHHYSPLLRVVYYLKRVTPITMKYSPLWPSIHNTKDSHNTRTATTPRTLRPTLFVQCAFFNVPRLNFKHGTYCEMGAYGLQSLSKNT